MICEKVEKSDIATIDKKKYLVPADLTVGQFVYVIRKRIKLSPEKAIFIFVDEQLPPTAALMSSIYEEHKDEDGFLYITYVFPCHSHSSLVRTNADADTRARTRSARQFERRHLTASFDIINTRLGKGAAAQLMGVFGFLCGLFFPHEQQYFTVQ